MRTIIFGILLVTGFGLGFELKGLAFDTQLSQVAAASTSSYVAPISNVGNLIPQGKGGSCGG